VNAWIWALIWFLLGTFFGQRLVGFVTSKA
jgi:hypothetical protein